MFVDTAVCAPCSSVCISWDQCEQCSGTHGLSHTLLTVSHEQVGDLLDHRIVAVLDMAVLWERQCRHLKLEARSLLQCGW